MHACTLPMQWEGQGYARKEKQHKKPPRKKDIPIVC